MGTPHSRQPEIDALRIAAQAMYRAAVPRPEIMAQLRITRGQLANFLVGMPAVPAPQPVRVKVVVPVAAAPVKQGDAARYCGPCQRRVLRVEARACREDCAAKRNSR